MKRIISSVLFLPVFVLLVYYGTPVYFFVLLSVALLIGLFEFFSMMEKSGRECYRIPGIFFGWLLLFAVFSGKQGVLPLVFAAALLTVFCYRLFLQKETGSAVEGVSCTLFGIVYLGFLTGYLMLLRNLEQGYKYVFLLFLVIWMGDTLAYYAGSTLGKKKLYPRISPNKTVLGSLGGLLGSTAGAFIAKYWFFPELGSGDCLVLGLLLGLFGQLGDLFESLIKRSAGVKDSGGIVPGHGGILDRVDSILFSAPLLYYYFVLLH